MDHKELFRDHSPYLGYGFLHYFFSGLGQTFLIAQFVPHFASSLGIDNAFFGSLYAVATLGSALLLPWVGGAIDRIRLRYLSIVNACLLAFFCFLIASMDNPYWLLLGLFGLRFCGQGFMVLIGSTALARYFSKARGKALSMGSLGLSLSEMLLPVIVIALIGSFGWRTTWIFLALAFLAVFLPAVLLLVQKRSPFQKAPSGTDTEADPRDRTRGQVLRDPIFWVLIPVALFVPFFKTGFFIHQNLVAEGKGWEPEWLGSCFLVYGAARILAYFMAGPLIDRFRARRVFQVMLLPLLIGLFILWGIEHRWAALGYMFFAGITGSLAASTNTALWAELYGIRHLGAIKGSVSTLMVLFTSLGAWVMEPLLGEGGEHVLSTVLMMALIILFLMGMAWMSIRYIDRNRDLPRS